MNLIKALSHLLLCTIFGIFLYPNTLFAENVIYESLQQNTPGYSEIHGTATEILQEWNELPVGKQRIRITEEDLDFSKIVKFYDGDLLSNINKEQNLTKLPYVWKLPVYKEEHTFVYVIEKEGDTWNTSSVLIYPNEQVDYISTLTKKINNDSNLLKEHFYFVENLDYFDKTLAVGYFRKNAADVIPVEKASEDLFIATEKSAYTLSPQKIYSYGEVVQILRNTPRDNSKPYEIPNINFEYLNKRPAFSFTLIGISGVVSVFSILIFYYCYKQTKA